MNVTVKREYRNIPIFPFWLSLSLTGLLFSCHSETASKPNTFPDHPSFTIVDADLKAIVSLQKLQTLPGYKLSVKSKNTTSELHIPDEVYRFMLADVNNDGHTDILLGMNKKTHFEPVMAKRLQILRIDSGKLRPLWMGSKLCQKLVDFQTVFKNDSCQVMTIEQDPEGLYAIGYYTWQDFGLRLLAYPNEKLVYSKASQFFQHEKHPY